MNTSQAFETLVDRFDYPMFVVTTAQRDRREGCLVGFATQASIEPSRLVVFLSKKNQTFLVAQQAAMLAVHVLDQEDFDIARLFGEETGRETDKFLHIDWSPGPDGVPILASTAGVVAGYILNRLDAGDHVGHVLEPSLAEVRRADFAPLSFQQVREFDPGNPVGGL